MVMQWKTVPKLQKGFQLIDECRQITEVKERLILEIAVILCGELNGQVLRYLFRVEIES